MSIIVIIIFSLIAISYFADKFMQGYTGMKRGQRAMVRELKKKR